MNQTMTNDTGGVESVDRTDAMNQLESFSRSQAVIEFELDGTIISANDNFCNALGYTLNEIKGQHHRIFCDPAYAGTPEYAEFWRTLGSGQFVSGEFKRITKDGSEIWIQATYNAILDEEGKPYKVVKLAVDITETKKRTMTFEAEASKVNEMMRQLPVNVMLVDENLVLQYMNETSYNTLKTIEHNLPVKVDDMIGTCIDIFHADPAVQRRILSDPKGNLPHKAEIVIGGEDVELQADAVFDQEGNFIGCMASWTIITEAKAAKAEADKVNEMMRQMPLNVMLVDENLVLQYMNETSYNTLKTIEHNLPVKVDDMIGTCIDIFHADPAVQRRILSDPKGNLPHKAEIVIGGEDVELQADAVFDQEDNFIGCMASWTVITKQKEMERQNAEAQERERQAAQDLKEKVEAVLEVATAAGEGDLTRTISFEGEDAMSQLADGFTTMVNNISAALRDVDSGTGQIDEGAQQISSASQSLSDGASTQASSLEEISSSLEEMTSMTERNADNCRQAAGLAEEGQKAAGAGSDEMKKMTQAMDEIKRSSDEISKIIRVIDEIAFQTNLLALNAAVEAARAGEAGKGFAVVAEEVRNLAQRSAEAAKNTSAMIEESSKRAENGVSIAEGVSKSLGEIVDSIDKVNALVAEISAASTEQSDGIKQINKGVSELDTVTQQNAGNAEELASSAEETAAQVTSLRDLVARFKIEEGGASSGRVSTPPAARQRPASAPTRRPTVKSAAKEAIPFDEEGHDALETF